MARSQRRRKRRANYRAPGSGPAPRAAERPRPDPPARVRRGDERPPAPWGSFPLVELAVLVALVLLVGGFVVQGGRGATMVAVGIAIGALAGLELSIREHFAGYRSHTVLLALTAGVASAALLTLVALELGSDILIVIPIAIGAAVFGVSFLALRRAFQRRSGGYSFRIGRLEG